MAKPMSRYRRAKFEGSLFFFTVVLAERRGSLLIDEIERLRRAYRSAQQRYPFNTVAICVLPDSPRGLGAASRRRRFSDPLEPDQTRLFPRPRAVGGAIRQQDRQA
jgi:hypothetical protein